MGLAPSAPSSPPVPFLVPREAPGAGRGHWLCPLAPAGTPGLCCSSPAPGAAPCSEHFRFWFPGISEKLVYTRELRCQGIKGRGRSCRSGVGQEEYKRQEPRGAPCGAASSRPSSRMNPEKRTWDRRGMGFLEGAAATVGWKLLEKLTDEAFERGKKGWEPEASKPQESWMKEDFQKFTREMTAMREDLQKGQEYTNWLFQLLRENLNKEQGKTEEENPPKAQGSVMEETIVQLCKEMKAMREDFQEGLASTKQDIQLLREDLNKELDRKMKKMMRAQESKMDKKFQQLCQRIQTLEQELHGVLIESASEDEAMIQMHRQLLSW
ncbi:uncharacterized protein LOC127461282 isoform X2 [Manacus candei]|uniref:uncharacterized protein LOC127461282 isoform X2 n=1 Tax=Manacus candei TaxID=415023 RepID=UPI00222663F3|nr:uncharacterized protein LOC127461282 isoform X2 [Manacus candei]